MSSISIKQWINLIKEEQVMQKQFFFRAPTDCLQFYTDISGTFQSFNFNNGNGAVIEKQNYNVCFRQAEGFFEYFYI
jgi:hypothetical protein